MTALRDSINALVALQQIDRQIQLLKRKQAGLDNGSASEALLVAARNANESATSAYHKAQGELKDCELKLAGLETKLKTYQQKLYQGGVTNAKELSNIEKEIAALGRQRSDLDGRILEWMESEDQHKSRAQMADAEFKAAQAKHQSVVEEYKSQYERINQEITSLTQQRADAQATVGDARLLKRYDDIRVKSGGLGIVQIANHNCGGCNMTLPTAQVKLVKDADTEIQICENCGRMLAP